MKRVLFTDLDDLALGAQILGSGGGGDPDYDLLIAKRQFEIFGGVDLLDVNELEEDAFVAPLSFMGAPLAGIEKLPNGNEFLVILKKIEEVMRKKVTCLLPAEIGGGNAFIPLIVASQLGLPVVDADTLGRAFPELQMSSCNLKGISPSPAFLSDCYGNTAVIYARDGKEVERLCRKMTVEMGSIAALSIYMMSGKQVKTATIRGSISKAIKIGRAMREARENGKDPVDSLLLQTGGIVLGSGMVVDIDQRIRDGFLKGTFTIHSREGNLQVLYQNEFLAVFSKGKALASTPDIIIPLEEETRKPISSETLLCGLRVILLAIPGEDLWKTSEGLSLVGPEYFSYSIDYNLINLKKEEKCCLQNI